MVSSSDILNAGVLIVDDLEANVQLLTLVSADMDLTGALQPISAIDEHKPCTAGDSTGGLGNVNAGIVALGPLLGDIDRNGRVDLADAVLTEKTLAGQPSEASSNADINNDGIISLAEMIYILQKVAGIR